MTSETDTGLTPMLRGWLILIIMTLVAGASFYTAEYLIRHWVFTALGYVSTAIGWYYYGIEHGWNMGRKNLKTNNILA